MDSPLILALLTLIGFGLGALIGWLIAGRSAAAARETVASLRLQLDGVTAEREEARKEAQAARDDHARAQAEIAGLHADARSHERQLQQLLEAKAALAAQFAEVGQKLLSDARNEFLKSADERFARAGESGELKLKALLAPVETTLKRYEENLARVEKEREGSYRELNRAVVELSQGNEIVRREAQRLANVMTSSPKARGRWGEEQTQTILETAGLRENIDFVKQKSVHDGDGLLRPDFIVNLPGDRCIVIDIKCPLVAFEKAFDEEDEVKRADYLLKHALAMKSYAADLGKKGYWRQFERSPEFVIMFIPGEHHLAAAAERAPDLIQTAFKDGVVIASTINLLALAKIMAGMWRQEALREQAKEIGEAGRELFKSLGVLSEHVAKLGKNLGTATGAYNDMIGSLEGNVYRGARHLAALGVESGGKAILTPPTVDKAIRPLIKLSVTETEPLSESQASQTK